jgi:hypothetical protein
MMGRIGCLGERSRRGRAWRVRVVGWLATVAWLFVVSCGMQDLSAGPPDRCTEAGARCRLASGPLGVCERSPCGAGATPPCFTCTPQH